MFTKDVRTEGVRGVRKLGADVNAFTIQTTRDHPQEICEKIHKERGISALPGAAGMYTGIPVGLLPSEE